MASRNKVAIIQPGHTGVRPLLCFGLTFTRSWMHAVRIPDVPRPQADSVAMETSQATVFPRQVSQCR